MGTASDSLLIKCLVTKKAKVNQLLLYYEHVKGNRCMYLMDLLYMCQETRCFEFDAQVADC